MKYTEVTFKVEPGVWRDMLVDELGNQGPYESFVDTPDGVKAYVPREEFSEEYLQSVSYAFPVPISHTVAELEDRNWNEEWEKQHESVLVHAANGKTIYVRAPFHPHRTDVDYELIIEPKMSFGTAHHPTTAMMLSYVAELAINGLRVLDMGCGTAVLAILAKMRGASEVDAIDIDEWAYNNALENADRNGVSLNIAIGDATLLEGRTPYDLVIANINRNILLADMDRYAAVMHAGSHLLLSGFYTADEGVLLQRANTLGMTLADKKEREGWSAMHLTKQQ